MFIRAFMSLGVSLFVWTFAIASSRAEEGPSTLKSVREKQWFVGLSGGAAYASVNHPLVIKGGFGTATLGMHAGRNVSERWAVGVELQTFEQTMVRDGANDPFAPSGHLQPQGGCNNCEPLPTGGWVGKTTAVFGTLGPRVEFAPLGRDGLYFGLSSGLGMILGIDTQYGLGGGARAGYRLRIANVLGLAVEGGVSGQYFSEGTTVFPYASLTMRPYF